MNRTAKMISGLLFLIITCVFIAACTGSSSTANTTSQTTLMTTAPSTSAQYTPGDIVRSPKESADTAWLVTGYDPATDSYERAFVYRNADGTWGYRLDTRTERANRAVMEKVYTEKITNKSLSSIPIRQPTGAATSAAVSTIRTVATATTATTALKPQIKSIEPDFGMTGSTVAITDLTGNYFQTGATVMLAKSGSPNITATSVTVQSPVHMSCSFSIPSDATTGPWEVVVTNSNGQTVRYANGFTVRVSTNPTTTTGSGGGVDITSIDPTFTVKNDVPMTIIGTNFHQGFTAKMTKSTNTNTEILARSVQWDSATQITCWFTIPSGSLGTWNVVITNTDGTTGTLVNGFEVKR